VRIPLVTGVCLRKTREVVSTTNRIPRVRYIFTEVVADVVVVVAYSAAWVEEIESVAPGAHTPSLLCSLVYAQARVGFVCTEVTSLGAHLMRSPQAEEYVEEMLNSLRIMRMYVGLFLLLRCRRLSLAELLHATDIAVRFG
jgi:hypothetical protein